MSKLRESLTERFGGIAVVSLVRSEILFAPQFARPNEIYCTLRVVEEGRNRLTYYVGSTLVEEDFGEDELVFEQAYAGIFGWCEEAVDGTLRESHSTKAGEVVKSRIQGLNNKASYSLLGFPFGTKRTELVFAPYPKS